MRSKATLRTDIHSMADKVKSTKVLQMVCNLLDLELREELESGAFPQELKDELEKRHASLKSGVAKTYSVEESIERARTRIK
jgi:hypothetical protein